MSLVRLAPFVLALGLIFSAAATCLGDGATKYDVRVGFNESVTQEDLDEVDALLREYDDDVDFLIQESFPPTGVATVETDAEDFCPRITSELDAKPYVREVSCQEHVEPVEDGDPDEPVSSTPQ